MPTFQHFTAWIKHSLFKKKNHKMISRGQFNQNLHKNPILVVLEANPLNEDRRLIKYPAGCTIPRNTF